MGAFGTGPLPTESSHSLFSLNIQNNIFEHYESKVIFINLFHCKVSPTSPQIPPTFFSALIY